MKAPHAGAFIGRLKPGLKKEDPVEHVILTIGKGRDRFGVFVEGIPAPNLPGLYFTRPLDPVDPLDDREWVLTHGLSGYVVTRAENVRIMARRAARLSAVSQVFGIDWTQKAVTKRDRRRMAAIQWALSPTAAMFNAPCPDAIETCMAMDPEQRPSDDVLGVLLG